MPSQTTCFIESTAISSVGGHAAPCHPRRASKSPTSRSGLLEGDPLEDLAEEALDDHPLGGRRGDAARLQVKEALRVDRADGGAVGAADVVVVDLEHRDRGRLGVVGEHQVAVGLVGVGAGGALLDPDQSGVDRPRGVLQRAFEEQVGGGVADLVVLQGVEVEELLAGGEVDALQLGRGAAALEVGLAADLGGSGRPG